jgi:hypothetical protein
MQHLWLELMDTFFSSSHTTHPKASRQIDIHLDQCFKTHTMSNIAADH